MPLISPLGHVECVAYDYRMYRMVSPGKGRPTKMPVYWGYAGTPFAIGYNSSHQDAGGKSVRFIENNWLT